MGVNGDRPGVQRTWQPRRPDGSLGDPVTFTLHPEDDATLCEYADRIDAMPVGPERTKLILDLAMLLDMFACFDGDVRFR